MPHFQMVLSDLCFLVFIFSEVYSTLQQNWSLCDQNHKEEETHGFFTGFPWTTCFGENLLPYCKILSPVERLRNRRCHVKNLY
jgi:hypothetical protein